MANLILTEIPPSKTGMLIRRPVEDVFEAFINPEITTKFWFTKSSGRLEAGKQVQWEWENYHVSIPVTVKAIEPNKRILIEWPGNDLPASVEWRFTPVHEGTTFVSITNSGFTGSGDEIVKQLVDSVEGFSLVLAGLKALLEHDLRLNLVADRFPAGIEEQ
ncbi:MAG: polyketide cyclase [Chloroflexi bacterium RBG_16_54_18]|nr:MAG: polyketide cyclase [Chloroflexi bacterium RBG_16_54_18]